MKPILGHAGRGVNELAAKYPEALLREYCAAKDLPLTDINVLLVGMAFKGYPETDDLRGSTAVEMWESLLGRCRSLAVWDAVVPQKVLVARGMQMERNLGKAIRMADAILVLNNHPNNVKLEHVLLSLSDKHRLVFDGWSQFEAAAMEASKHVTYATMGYMSIRKLVPLK